MSTGKIEKSHLLEVENLKMHFPVFGGVFWRRKATVYAADGVSFKVAEGETLGLVGESGCGKTTVGRAVLRLHEPTGGRVVFDGRDLTGLNRKELRDLRRDMQMIFQDPFESLNARHTIGSIVREPFDIHDVGKPDERNDLAMQLLHRVGLPENAMSKFPHEFSGGQRQRIGIARAVALNPKLVVCDEPVSALDVSIQSQILNLLMELQRESGMAYVFIAHDLAVVRHISDHVAVMYLGKIMEYTDADTIYEAPLHPYTKVLISAIPIPDPSVKREKRILVGDVPSPIDPPPGCRFQTRCPDAEEQCRNEEPELRAAAENHLVACHLV